MKKIKMCLHKFCDQCIQKYSKDEKRCPQCRKPISSHRVYRDDINTGKIINLLVTDIKGFNKVEHEKRKKLVNEGFDIQKYKSKISEGEVRQREQWEKDYGNRHK
jgi:hypothetical protein